MCGIVGIIDKNDTNIKQNISNMLARIYLRGPDGEGRYEEEGIELAMRRLSIIDIENGQQPFFSKDGNVVAFQNGEIYNFIELRKELKERGYDFRSHSDTEVLAHGYSEWGINTLLTKLEGMYAICIYDKLLNKLILARDRFGEKPLYYSIDEKNHRFTYASDLRAILKLDWVDNSLSDLALSRYLMLGFTSGEESIIGSIKKVLPSHFIELDLKGFNLKEECYYLPNLFNDEKIKEKREKLIDKLNYSIDLRLRSDVPVGVFLSGGIDSSLVASLVSAKKSNIDTFSIGFYSDEHDESQYAKKVANHIKSNHHHFMFNEDSFVELLPEVVSALDEPLADQACLPTYWLSKEAKKHVTVVLSGEGADEAFGGYSYYKQFENQNKISNMINNDHSSLPSGFPFLMSTDMCKEFLNSDFQKSTHYENQLIDWLNTSHSGILKAMATDLTTWLPDDLLVKLDRMAMANSLEGRTPYLCHKLINFSYSLSQSDWISNSEYKCLLREVASEYLPREIFDRPKQGFVLPMDRWLVKWFEKKGIEDFFYSRRIPKLSTSKIVKWVKNELKKPVFNQRLVFALVMLYEWYGITFKEIS